MTMNPADEAAENYKNETDKLRAEVSKTTQLKENQNQMIFNLPITDLLINCLFLFQLQIERLKRKIRKMEDEHQDLTTRLNETTSGTTTVNIQEVSIKKSFTEKLFFYLKENFY